MFCERVTVACRQGEKSEDDFKELSDSQERVTLTFLVLRFMQSSFVPLLSSTGETSRRSQRLRSAIGLDLTGAGAVSASDWQVIETRPSAAVGG